MCSIEGFTGKHNFTIQEFTAFNKDRGPDDTGYYEDGCVAIGHNLLAIQDNPNGIDQPYVDADGNVLTYNGEIYAYNSKPLPDIDTRWLSSALHQKQGRGNHPAKFSEGFRELYDNTDGMWAYAYYNPKNQTILLNRDHFGVKPLYYLEFEGNLFWSSTVKPLIAVLHHYDEFKLLKNWKTLSDQRDGWHIPPDTYYDKIKSVFPGQYLCWSIDQGKFLRQHGCLWRESQWDLRPNFNYDPEEFREILIHSTNMLFNCGNHKKAISLSGGLDSTLLAGMVKNRKDVMTTSVVFDGPVDRTTHENYMKEAGIAKKTAMELGIPHSEAFVRPGFDADENIEDTYGRIGQYMWLSSRVVPRHENIKNAKKNGAKIYVTGDLADEIVTGYGGHTNYVANVRRHLQREFVDKNLINSHPIEGYQQFADWMPFEVNGGEDVLNNLFVRLMASSESFCVLIDHLCGSYGMESRVPYLYQSFAKYALKIPAAHKLRVPFVRETDTVYKSFRSTERDPDNPWNGRWTPRVRGTYKWLFREEMKDFIPQHVLRNIDKVGFSTPWDSRNHRKNDQIRDYEVNHIQSVVPQLYRFEMDKK